VESDIRLAPFFFHLLKKLLFQQQFLFKFLLLDNVGAFYSLHHRVWWTFGIIHLKDLLWKHKILFIDNVLSYFFEFDRLNGIFGPGGGF